MEERRLSLGDRGNKVIPVPATTSFEDLDLDLYERFVDLQRRLSGVELADQHGRQLGS